MDMIISSVLILEKIKSAERIKACIRDDLSFDSGSEALIESYNKRLRNPESLDYLFISSTGKNGIRIVLRIDANIGLDEPVHMDLAIIERSIWKSISERNHIRFTRSGILSVFSGATEHPSLGEKIIWGRIKESSDCFLRIIKNKIKEIISSDRYAESRNEYLSMCGIVSRKYIGILSGCSEDFIIKSIREYETDKILGQLCLILRRSWLDWFP
jgi:hypothetical protein